jgi:hypothetical protein
VFNSKVIWPHICWVLVVGNLTAILTPDPNFGHNPYITTLNGTYELFCDIYIYIYIYIYISRVFPMVYWELNLDHIYHLHFHHKNLGLSTWDNNSPSVFHLEVFGNHYLTFATFVKVCLSPKTLPNLHHDLSCLFLVMSPRLGLWHNPSQWDPITCHWIAWKPFHHRNNTLQHCHI